MAQKNKLIIYAPNIHQGGGRFLLVSLVKVLAKTVYVFLDGRMRGSIGQESNLFIRYIRPTIFNRFLGELELRRLANEGSMVLCLGNLPPLFRLRGKTIVFLQNRYLVNSLSLSQLGFRVCMRILIERYWLKFRACNADEFIVQSFSMKRLLEEKLGSAFPVSIKPFVFNSDGYARSHLNLQGARSILYDYIYVASGESHKNHRLLVSAWVLLAEEGIFPSLCITVDREKFPLLCDWIDVQIKSAGINVVNLGNISHEEVLVLYKKSGAAIYPSTLESFGIPLIEARQAGLAVLASELDYVRDVLDPEESFDPCSAISIARSVKRHMGVPQSPLPIMNAVQFINFLMEG